MKRILLTLLPVLMFAAGIAAAGPAPPTVESLAKIARAQTNVPPEWDGIWTTQDTVYLCPSTVLSVPAPGSDTLCGGSEYSASSGGIVLSCSGTADATTLNVTCTGNGQVTTGCTADITVTTHGTRTNNTFFTVSTLQLTNFVGGIACLGLPTCLQINTHGTRTGPTTAADCATTPTKQSTWGQLKVIYR